MKHLTLVIAVALALSGCAAMPFGKRATEPAQIVAPVEPAVTLPALGAGTTAEALDQTTTAERAAAVLVPAAEGRALGKVTVALGSPAEQGFWLKTTLVSVAGTGRVVTASGASVAVDLIPAQGAALLSLAAFRALGLSLTDVPEVSVFQD